MIELSIIVPLYNNEKYINRCLDSIVRFTEFEWECIVINDGSQDNSGQIAEIYSKEYTQIKCVNIENGGVSNARNVGIKMAKGKAITFIDSDDWFLDDAECELSAAIKRISKGETTVFGHVKVGTNFYTSIPLEVNNAYSYEKKIKALTVETQKINNCWGIVYDKAIIDGYSLEFDTKMKVGEDACFVLEYLTHVNQLFVSDKQIIAYWSNTVGAMHRTRGLTISDDEKCYYKRLEVMNRLGIKLSEDNKTCIASVHLSNVIGYMATECVFKNALAAHEYIKKINESEYVQELLYWCSGIQYSFTKRVLIKLMAAKMYWCVYFCCCIYMRKRGR